MDENHKPNSHKYNDENKKEKLDKIIKGPIKRKKRSSFRKITDIFFTEVAPGLKNYIIHDVIFPSMQNLFTEGINMTFDVLNPVSKRSISDKVSFSLPFRKYSGPSVKSLKPSDAVNYRSLDFDQITFDNRGEAEKVLQSMRELISAYGVATLSDFYDLLGVTGSWADNNYGWISLSTADVVRSRDGYIIRFPKVTPVD